MEGRTDMIKDGEPTIEKSIQFRLSTIKFSLIIWIWSRMNEIIEYLERDMYKTVSIECITAFSVIPWLQFEELPLMNCCFAWALSN